MTATPEDLAHVALAAGRLQGDQLPPIEANPWRSPIARMEYSVDEGKTWHPNLPPLALGDYAVAWINKVYEL